MGNFLSRIRSSRIASWHLLVAAGLKLCAQANAQGLFILAKQGITINGGTFDSFDSTDPAYSTGGRYDPSKAKDDCLIGTVATNLVPAMILTNNARVNGSGVVGAGSSFFVTDTSSMGTRNWITGGNNGIQTGHFRNDLNLAIADVQTPAAGGLPPLPGVVGGTNYAYLLSGSVGRYQMPALTMSSSQT
jgi:hypothetical protein